MWISVLLATLFGILEGVTEWLPISSTGHMILLREVLPHSFGDAFFELFEVVIQLGAMAAVPLLFFDTLSPFGKSRQKRRQTLRLWSRIALAVLPAALLGLLLDDVIDKLLFNPLTVAITLVFYGVLFLVLERRNRVPRVRDAADLSLLDALRIGCFQVLALIPGTSRSGATVTGGLLLGISRPAAAAFSFFLGVPTMAGAGLLKAAKFFLSGGVLSRTEWVALAVGTLVAFLVSLAVIRFLMDFVRRHTFIPFGIYRILLGAAVLLTLIF